MKVYILKTITVNDMEPAHYASHEDVVVQGIFISEESAIAKMEELHDKYRAFELANPEWYYISQSCTIEEYELIP